MAAPRRPRLAVMRAGEPLSQAKWARGGTTIGRMMRKRPDDLPGIGNRESMGTAPRRWRPGRLFPSPRLVVRRGLNAELSSVPRHPSHRRSDRAGTPDRNKRVVFRVIRVRSSRVIGVSPDGAMTPALDAELRSNDDIRI